MDVLAHPFGSLLVEIDGMGGSRLKKRVVCFVFAVVLTLALAGCSDPKRDAQDTNIQQQMENGILDISD